MLAKSMLFNARRCVLAPVQSFGFTRSFRKVLLTEDVPNLGF